MGSPSVPTLLAAWRAAERRWERHGSANEIRAAALEVVAAWAAYQDAAVDPASREFMLAADDEGLYVAATGGVRHVLGYAPSELIGQRIADLAAPQLRETTPGQWSRFLADGRQDGTYELQAKDGRTVTLHYQARAHHPVPGFHVSRLWPEPRES